MEFNRHALILTVVAAACSIAGAWVLLPGIVRVYAVNKFLRLPGARARAAVVPQKRTLTALPVMHPVNLGYATFDTGSTNSISLETTTSGAAVVLTNAHFQMVFLPPFCPQETDNRTSASAKITAREARSHPHTLGFLQLMETNSLSGEMRMEEARELPLAKILFLSSDDFLLYTITFGHKVTCLWGANEVQFFESPTGNGIVRIGKSAEDRRFAGVFFASADGTRAIGYQLLLSATCPSGIAEVLDPVIRSFQFTAEDISDREKVKALIRKAGILQRPENWQESADTRP
jgi:hypothetical protein